VLIAQHTWGLAVFRIIEWLGLQRTTMLIQFQPPAMCRVANQQPRLPRATSSLALNACRDGELGLTFSVSECNYRKMMSSSGWEAVVLHY